MLNLVMNAGILSSIFNGIKSVVNFVLNFVDIIKGLFQAVIIYLFAPIYYLFMGVCSIVNFAEMMFKKLAGIDPITLGTGEQVNILDMFIRDDSIWYLFISILVLSIVLLFIFTVVAVIKSEFAIDAKGSAKGPIIARSLKSLAMFIIVPIVSLLGVYATNAITDTINSMMKGGDDTGMVQQIFYAMSYNANKARINPEFAKHINGFSSRNGGKYRNDNAGAFKGDNEAIATQIGMAFKGNHGHNASSYKNLEFLNFDDYNGMFKANDYSTLFMPISWSKTKTYSVWDLCQVNYYFSIIDMDWIVGFGSAIVITYMLLAMACVLIKRIFEIVILMLLAVPMISLAPLDGGSASKSWQKEFIKRVISIVAPVFSINMYFIMIPIFNKVQLFGGNAGALQFVSPTYAVYDTLFQLIIICVGMNIVKTASALLCNLLGIQDLVKDGDKQTKDGIKKAASTAISIAGAVATGGAAAGAMGAMKAAGGAAKAAGKAVKSTEKGVSAAKQQLADAEASGDQTKIAEAKSNLAEKETARDKAVKDYSTANADYEKKKKLADEKKDALFEKVAPSTFKGIKDVKDTWKNKDKSKSDVEAEKEARKKRDVERAATRIEEQDADKAKKAEAAQEKRTLQRRAEGQVEHHYESIEADNKKKLKDSQESVAGLQSELQAARIVAQGTASTLQGINAEDRSQMSRGQKGAHTKRKNATEDLLRQQVGDIEAGEELVAEETAKQAGYKANAKDAAKKKKQALKAINSGEADLAEDMHGNIGAEAPEKRGPGALGNTANVAVGAAAAGPVGAAIAASQIVADSIHNKQMQTGTNAINEAKTAADDRDASVDERNAAKAGLQKDLDDAKQEVSLDPQAVGEGVQQGINEALSQLTEGIKRAMEASNLKVSDIKNIAAELKAIKTDLKNAKQMQAGGEKDAAMKSLEDAIKKLVDKLK